MRSSTAVGLPDVFGRFTSMPRYMSGAVSMKIKRRTSVTSTRGMMLISASVPPMRWPPCSVSAESTLMAMGSRHPGRRLGERATDDVQEFEPEAIHLHRPVLHAIHEEVVAHDRRDGSAETSRRGDQCLGDAWRHDGQVC